MVRVGSAAWLVFVCAAGCGGNTASAKPDPAENTAGTTSTAGTSSTPGGAASSAGGNGSTEPLACQESLPACIANCGSLDFGSPDCVDGHYRCPEGWVELGSCPAQACANRSQTCCSPTGHVTVPDCAADGTIGDCPAGFAQKDRCLPEGVNIQNCSELANGDACASEELTCYTSKCGRNCDCKADATGRLSWQCSALPC
ncbi:MAG: hypothetical protein ABUL60_13230 [Myxococcales bacterium]